jgi:hypothetical protein
VKYKLVNIHNLHILIKPHAVYNDIIAHTINRVKWTFYNQPYRSGTNITLDPHGENVYGGIYMVGGRGGLFLGNAACCDQ